jgi:hypothetical protein
MCTSNIPDFPQFKKNYSNLQSIETEEFNQLFFVLAFVIFLLAIVLSVPRFTVSDKLFGIFRLFLYSVTYCVCDLFYIQ